MLATRPSGGSTGIRTAGIVGWRGGSRRHSIHKCERFVFFDRIVFLRPHETCVITPREPALARRRPACERVERPLESGQRQPARDVAGASGWGAVSANQRCRPGSQAQRQITSPRCPKKPHLTTLVTPRLGGGRHKLSDLSPWHGQKCEPLHSWRPWHGGCKHCWRAATHQA